MSYQEDTSCGTVGQQHLTHKKHPTSVIKYLCGWEISVMYYWGSNIWKNNTVLSLLFTSKETAFEVPLLNIRKQMGVDRASVVSQQAVSIIYAARLTGLSRPNGFSHCPIQHVPSDAGVTWAWIEKKRSLCSQPQLAASLRSMEVGADGT